MKKIFLVFFLICTTFTLSADPIGESRARQIAEEFFAERATTRSTEPLHLEWAGNTISEPICTGDRLNTSLMYIYNRGENGGFVVVAGDSNTRPIIAYSLDTTFDCDNLAEATKAILDAWCKQIEAARNEKIPANLSHSTTRSGDELLYETALWNQGEPYNREAPVYDGYRSVTGCTATAMAIICHYNRWPDYGVGTTPEYSYYDAYDKIRTVPANTLGRTYNYNNMLFDYNNGYTESQANAVAALMKDMGTSVYMSYHYTESGASSFNNVQAFTNYFKYSKEAKLICKDNYSIAEWNEMMRENLRKCGPTFYSGGGDVGGHAFVIDGYSYDDYFHINYGWGGSGNAWYLLPYIDFYARQAAIFGLIPDKNGTTQYKDNILLTQYYSDTSSWHGLFSTAQEYVVGESFYAYLGALNNVGGRVFNGSFALVHCNKDGEWKELIYSWEEVGFNIGSLWGLQTDEGATINYPIEEGDTIRAFFKSSDSNEWVWIRAWGGYATEEILLSATPEEIAKTLTFHFDKANNTIYIESPHAMQIELHRPSGEVTKVKEMGHSYIWYRILENGEHTLKVHSGGRPYELKLKF